VIRAAAVGDADVRSDVSAALAPGFRVVEVPAVLATGDPICFRRDTTRPATCSAARDLDGTARVGTAAGVYPPPYYALVGVPVRVLGGARSTEAYRVAAIALTAAILVSAVLRARRLGPAALFVVVGVPPAAWFLFGVVNPTSPEIALALLAWVGVALVRRDDTWRALAWISAPAAAAVVLRPVALLPAVALTVVASVLVERVTWRRRAVLWTPVAVAALAVATWNVWVELEFDDPRTAQSASTVDAMWTALSGVPTTLVEALSDLSWQEIRAPWPAQVLSGAVTIGMVVVVWRQGTTRVRWAAGAWLLALVLGPVAFEVLAHDRVGFIWQGRYSISTLVGLGALAARAVAPSHDGEWTVSETARPHTSTRALPWAAWVLAAVVAELAAFWSLLRRYAVGTDGSWWMTGAAWEPAVDPRLLLAVHVAVLAGSAVAVVRVCAPASETPTRHPTK
jgi:hypothetical protein